MEKATPELVAKLTGAKKALKPKEPSRFSSSIDREDGDLMSMLQQFLD
jgi:hypothetical protein